MNNPQFSVLYNGHPVAITMLDNGCYMVQVTYKPVKIQMKKNSNGTESWIEVDSQLETYLTNEIGRLITDHQYSFEHV